MEDLIESLGKAKLFPILNADSKYWQLNKDKKDVNETAFAAQSRLCKYIVVLFELRNAPETSRRSMEVILAPAKLQCAPVFINEIIIFFTILEKHSQRIEIVPQLQNTPT